MANKNQKRFPVYYNADKTYGKKIDKWLAKQENASRSVRKLILSEESNKKEIAFYKQELNSLKEQVRVLILSLGSQGPRLTEKQTEVLQSVETNIGHIEERIETKASTDTSFYFDIEE
jgi:hypothetical protein